MRRTLLFAFVMTGSILAAPAAAAAQVRIEGHVIDNETLSPISGARVVITMVGREGSIARLFTDDDGLFVYEAPEDAGYRFHVDRLGYRETETPILWTDGYRDYDIEIRLDPEAVLLAPIEVVARSAARESPVLENFWERLDTGLGHYFTREEIEEIGPNRVSDLLRRVPGVQLQSSGAGLRQVVYMSRGVGRCRAEVFIDGMRWTRRAPLAGPYDPGFTVDDAVAPESVEGVEVYKGLATVPAEFLTPDADCGVVAIWTRR